ncbi:MAG: hypothetical protein ACFFEN_10970 [Candidatus Thorarchaeota archaeon]
MFKDLLNYYKIGKQIGLSRKEINKIFIFDNTNHPTLYLVLMIVGIILFGVAMVFLGVFIMQRTYLSSGALYSTVKEKDFKQKKVK